MFPPGNDSCYTHYFSHRKGVRQGDNLFFIFHTTKMRRREINLVHLRGFEKLQNSFCLSSLQSCKDVISFYFTLDELLTNYPGVSVLTQLITSEKFHKWWKEF